MIRNPAFLFICVWDNFKEFEYFLITNQVKSVIKIFRQKNRGVIRFRFIIYIFTNGVAAGFDFVFKIIRSF
jgi:hypothetical protein